MFLPVRIGLSVTGGILLLMAVGACSEIDFTPIVTYRSVNCDAALCDKTLFLDSSDVQQLLDCYGDPERPGEWGRGTPKAIKENCWSGADCTFVVAEAIEQPMTSECICVDDFGYPDDPPRASCCLFPEDPTLTTDWTEPGAALAERIYERCRVDIEIGFQLSNCRWLDDDEEYTPASWSNEICPSKSSS